MIPVGIVLLLLEVVVEFIIEVIEARFLVRGGLRDRQILLVPQIFIFIVWLIGTLDVSGPTFG